MHGHRFCNMHAAPRVRGCVNGCVDVWPEFPQRTYAMHSTLPILHARRARGEEVSPKPVRGLLQGLVIGWVQMGHL